MKRLIIVTKKNDFFQSILAKSKLQFKIFDNKIDLNNFIPQLSNNDVIISFNHNIIFSEEVLSKIKIGYNIHAASPDFPGRDPHHWAVYCGAKRYGAVAHIINRKVDSGGIVDAILFDIDSKVSPNELLNKANIAAEKLIIKLVKNITNDINIKVRKDLSWGNDKKSRRDFLNICHIPNDISIDELNRRIKAFHIEGRTNLYTTIRDKPFFLLQS